ncbi:MAG: hypothetical protein RL431_176 [Actinomycetota bacterium]
MSQRTPWAGRRTFEEVVIVLLLSYGMSALYAVGSIMDRMMRAESLASQSTTINRPLATQEWFDLAYQVLGIGTGLAPVALVLWLMWNSGAPRFQSLGLTGGWREARRSLLHGITFAAAIGIPGIGVYLASRAAGISLNVVPTDLDAHWWTIPVLIAWAIRAGLGEEIIVIGYLRDRLTRLGVSSAWIIVGAALLRGTYHLYQGFGGFIGNVLMGLIFGWWYARTGRLGPLIVAHIVMDVAVFVGYPLAATLFPTVFGG